MSIKHKHNKTCFSYIVRKKESTSNTIHNLNPLSGSDTPYTDPQTAPEAPPCARSTPEESRRAAARAYHQSRRPYHRTLAV